LYLYYDKDHADNTTYIGDIGSTPAQNVWDSNFVGVWHMSQDPTGGSGCIKDSTSNTNHGTPGGSMTSGDLVDGKTGKALDFDGSDDCISLPDNSDFKPDYVSVEALCKTDTGNADWVRIFDRSYFSASNIGYALVISDVGKARFHPILTGNEYHDADSTDVIEGDGKWHYLVGSYEDNHTKFYDNGNLTEDEVGGSGKVVIHQESQVPQIGNGVYDSAYKGIIDELRISNIARSASWIKATYYSNWDSLITFGSEEIVVTNHFDGKVRIKDSVTNHFDGKVRIKDSVTNHFDGKVDINTAINHFDGKARIKDFVTNLFDGKAKIKDSVTNLFDGKAKIKVFATNLLDGKTWIVYTGQINDYCPTPTCEMSAVFRYARIEASPPIPTASFRIGRIIEGYCPVPGFTCTAYSGRNPSIIA
ncbi:MAG: LamG domain-containing protein, partial [candidate division Zixibacteria bacterium]|nr:LamG domain-containing protein [candidate division Zixibacteria bacterium]